ncbi:hypothetical protein V5O48_001753 [Marasmius crinis-equi]|uniref:AB hydrolase-1 domain-containing protein n=1 Tax=Marasmius crinis-equi TaxID=585013 RepID=A0ABR3FY12_9AGAR
MFSATLKVNDTSGVELAYLDSGAPEGLPDYTTIFIVHGMIFTNGKPLQISTRIQVTDLSREGIFEKMLIAAPQKGVRVVAIQRRHFPGSTPFSPEELSTTLSGGTEAERVTYSEARGHELALFIAEFISKFNLPPASGAKGGSVLLGWSVGGILPVLAIRHSKTLPNDVKERLGAHIRSLIVYESAPLCFGLPMPTQNWSPLVDESVPQNKRLQLFGQWCTGYFDHGNFTLETPHDPDLLEWILHTPADVPALYNIPTDKLNKLATYGDDASTDLPFLFFFQNEHKKALVKALMDEDVAAIFPKLKRGYITGSRAPAFGIAGMWAFQDEKELAGAPIEFKIIQGGNHFAIWDEPEKVLDAAVALA